MKILFFILFELMVIAVYSQSNPPLEIPFLDEEITIDGQLDETVWGEIKTFTDFHNHYPSDEGFAKNQTEVKIFHNQQFLFISAIYHDEQTENNVNSLKRDVYFEAIHSSDCFGVVLDPYQEGNNGYFFAVNASGVQFDALIGNIDELNESWNTVWKCQVNKQGKDNIYEIAIPLDAINFNPLKNVWGIQLYTNDTKQNIYSTWEHSPRNFVQFDLRYTKKVSLENLPSGVSNKFSLLPSLAANYTKDKIESTENKRIIPSLDAQYNITPSLRLDATINPDFSQVEVDQQVANLTRFAINFPERRKFFLENSDLFNDLGTGWSNPFYSRRIGAETDILLGAKLSGNVGNSTRIGILNAQTKDDGDVLGKNYTVLVGRQNLSPSFFSTMYLINSQQKKEYNRVGGARLNFKAPNNKWTGNVNYAHAFTREHKSDNNLMSSFLSYNSRRLIAVGSFERVGRNYIAETGFVPQLYNYDPITDQTVREGFFITDNGIQLRHIPKNSEKLDWVRIFWLRNTTFLNEDYSLRENRLFLSPFAIRFKNTSYIYATYLYNTENLKYNFDFLQNGNYITPGEYHFHFGRVGYWSPAISKFYYRLRFEYGQFYNGTRLNPEVELVYRLMPRAVLSGSYQFNEVNLNELGKRTFHLASLTTEIYFSNRLNWTTYFQYNTQGNNFNINSRIQWEYKPLSYLYLVVTNNYDNQFIEKNWGVSFKINRRLDF